MRSAETDSFIAGLIERILLLDARAYQEFALMFGPLLRDYLHRKGLPSKDAEELAVDSLNAALGKVREYRPEVGPFPEWVFRIADGRYSSWLQRLCSLRVDLEAAATTQIGWFPRNHPSLPGLDAYFVHRPLRVVTGDFCEIYPLGESTAISIGDASGKGASAALYGAMAQSYLRAIQRHGMAPSSVLAELDKALKGFHIGTQYTTLLYSLWRPAEARFLIASAGAPAVAVLSQGNLNWIKMEGPALGWPMPTDFEEIEVPVVEGDIVTFYSDGIPDQPDEKGTLFGDTQFGEALKSSSSFDPEHAAWSVLADLDRFRGAEETWDDQTLLMLRVL